MLGIVGAGKGTQAKKLAEHLEIPHISTGDIFREAVKKKTELGLKAQKIMEEGDLVPDDIVLGIVKERLEESDTGGGYILDGFPRTINQAEKFDRVGEVDIVFYISIPEEESVRRLKGRRLCSRCKRQYNVYLNKEINGTCPACSGRLIQRSDDKEETVKIRIKNYIKQTKPLIKYYRKQDKLIEINGYKSIKEVFKSVIDSLPESAKPSRERT